MVDWGILLNANSHCTRNGRKCKSLFVHALIFVGVGWILEYETWKGKKVVWNWKKNIAYERQENIS